MDTKNRMGILIGVFVVFLATLVIGVGIKTFWSKTAKSESQEKLPESEPAATAAKEKPSKGVAFTRWMITEAAQSKAKAEIEAAPPEAEPLDVQEEEETEQKESQEDALEEENSLIEDQGQTDSGKRTWQTVWADLNLTDEEKGRLRQGVMLLVQRWMAMPPEEQQAERDRMLWMRDQFMAMSEDEKLEVSQRIKDRFEDWRMSDRIELPELTLD